MINQTQTIFYLVSDQLVDQCISADVYILFEDTIMQLTPDSFVATITNKQSEIRPNTLSLTNGQ